MAGISDRTADDCFAVALWNGQRPDPERTDFRRDRQRGQSWRGREGILLLSRLDPDAFLHEVSVQVSAGGISLRPTASKRTGGAARATREFELLDTGIFDDDRYFDVFVEYAKADAEDILIQITVANRGPEAADLRLLPTVWFRNTWSWGQSRRGQSFMQSAAPHGRPVIELQPRASRRIAVLHCEGSPELLFTENETNAQRLFGTPNRTPYVKDAFHHYVVNGARSRNPEHTGTKAAADYRLTIGAGESVVIRLRLADTDSRRSSAFEEFGQRSCRAYGRRKPMNFTPR